MQKWWMLGASVVVVSWIFVSCQQVKPEPNAEKAAAQKATGADNNALAKADADKDPAAAAGQAGHACKGDCKGGCKGKGSCDCKGKGPGHAGCKGCKGGQGGCKEHGGGHGHGGHGGHGHAKAQGGHDCTGGAGGALLNNKVTERTGPDGKKVLHAGAAFATGTATVEIEDLLGKPDEYKGKTVRVSGHVSAMCSHKRGWFALPSKARGGGFIRVITVPNFLVPEGSIGKVAVAEGTVQVIEVGANAAKHFAKDHKLGKEGAVKGAQKRVIIRAAGADFS